jgi:xanthine dehydrogenase YagR molybdenum-binding subunit
MTGHAVVEAAREIKKQIAEKGLPKGGDVLTASVNANPAMEGGKARNSFGAHFAEVEADTETGHVRVVKYVAVHDSGRIMNPLTATSQIRGAVIMGIGMALHEELQYDPRSGQPLTAGFYGQRVATHLDAPPDIDVIFIENDDGYGPFGAKSIGEAGKLPAPAAVANAIFNATGKRMKDLPIRRSRLIDALA